MEWLIRSAHAAEVAHGVSHAAETSEAPKEMSLHILNFIRLITGFLDPQSAVVRFLHRFEDIIFVVLIISVIGLIFRAASKNLALVPGRLQSVCEVVVGWLDNFVCGILGPQGKKYTPFIGTLFIYIWFMNMTGLVPLMKAPTASALSLTIGVITLPIPTVTAALAILVFFYVQSIGVKNLGILGYLHHMAGSPRDVFGYVLMPLMFCLHVIGEFAKPLSLMFRLYGNIWGEDVLLAVFIGLGVGIFAFMPVPMGAPLHFPFLLLAMVTGTIQAFVFTLLTTVYIAMMLPHEHEEEHAQTAH